MDRAYHLITSCDDNLTAYLPVQIYAIAHHLTDRPVHIWFLQNGISEKVIRTLEKMGTYMRSGGTYTFMQSRFRIRSSSMNWRGMVDLGAVQLTIR